MSTESTPTTTTSPSAGPAKTGSRVGSRRWFLKRLAALGVGVAFAPPAWAWSTRRIVVERLQAAVPGVEARVRLVHVTDLHLSCSGDWPLNASEAFVRHALSLAVSEDPDLILFTGDLVSSDNAKIDDYRRAIAILADEARGLPVYASLGNHETWFDPDAVLNAYAERGIPAVDDSWLIASVGGQDVVLAGLRYVDGQYDAAGLLASAPGTRPRVLLAHDPAAVLDLPTPVEFDLVLSGHTHGGQAWLPIIGAPWTPSRAYPDYYRGSHALPGGCILYANRGVGTYLAPIRLWSRPEVAIIDLVPLAEGASR